MHAEGGETAKAHARRLREGWYDQHIKAPCIDLGCGRDPLLAPFPVRRWDIILGDGDAQKLEGVPDNSYQTVYASHLLEHVVDPVAAVRRWYEILAPGGKLIICVPSRRLYEKKNAPPSRWNSDHKTFWELEDGGPETTTYGLRNCVLRGTLTGEIISLRVLDEGYVSNGPNQHSSGEFSLECVVRKPDFDTDILKNLARGHSTQGVEKLTAIYRELLRTDGLPGDVAEFGVWKGGTAKVIGYGAPGVPLHLFDTFSGMPEDDSDGGHHKGDFSDCDIESVRKFLDNPAAIFHVGIFPETAPPDVYYRFVHIDCDIRQSVEAALDYFPPRMVSGGVILFDDYNWPRCPGVKTAIHNRYDNVEVVGGNQAVLRF